LREVGTGVEAGVVVPVGLAVGCVGAPGDCGKEVDTAAGAPGVQAEDTVVAEESYYRKKGEIAGPVRRYRGHFGRAGEGTMGEAEVPGMDHKVGRGLLPVEVAGVCTADDRAEIPGARRPQGKGHCPGDIPP
jgi:hypothetical protein